jgi:hypothetical protein
LANCHGDSGEPESAEALERPAMALLRETLGAHHPDTLVCEANLAISLRQEGHTQDAKELQAQVLADFARILGSSHPDSAQLHKWQRINRDLEPQQI